MNVAYVAGTALAALVSYVISRPIGGIIRGTAAILIGSLMGVLCAIGTVLVGQSASDPSFTSLILSGMAGGAAGLLYAHYKRKGGLSQ